MYSCGDSRMNKDKIYGYGIFGITGLLMLLYTIWVPITYLVNRFLLGLPSSQAGNQVLLTDASQLTGLPLWLLTPITPFEGILIPVYLVVMMVGIIIAWIGLTMATTPPPEPIDLDDLDLEEFEETKVEKEKSD